GIFSAMHTLPQLAAAALLDTTIDKPGWQEARKLAGRPYATVTAGAAFYDDSASLGESALENRENIVRLLNTYISALIRLRDEIDTDDREAVTAHLEDSLKRRNRWIDERNSAKWVTDGEQYEAPSLGERMNQLFLGSALRNRQKQRK
ncbi:MAG TPA: hypothetical protein VK249_18870, partial [Anaerolineales bacterium]|nr:hypothetical protein [Anaerolineales bacterium]